ncbi:MAG: thymidine kinase [Coxiella sp. (in: Bacteria)]|nr:MAG: thymidine kinase [Coxiella sp. (in: g-proteobacteria)]
MAKLHFYYSAMNAGKSTTLLQSSYNYRERGMDTLIFTPAADNRYGEGIVSSRIGIEADAVTFTKDADIIAEVRGRCLQNPNIFCVLVDEAQFLSKSQVYQLCQIADDMKIPVLAYGLRSDFQGEPFEGSMYLLAWADLLLEIKTICHCGSKATMNMRIDEKSQPVREGNQVEIGGNDRYVSVCRRHYRLGKATSNGRTRKITEVSQSS